MSIPRNSLTTPATPSSKDNQIAALKLLWNDVLPDSPVPRDTQFRVWLNLYPLHIVQHGIARAGGRQEQNFLENKPPLDFVDLNRYASGVMRNVWADEKLAGG